MKRNLTFVLSVLALMACLIAPKGMNGQTSSIEINTTNSGVTGSYQDKEFDVDDITFKFTQWMKSNNIQAKKSTTNSLYNIDAIPGTITSIVFVQTGTARAITVYGGTSQKPTNQITSPTTGATMTFDFSGRDYNYFSMTTPGNACYFNSITINYIPSGGQQTTTYTVTYNANVTGVSPVVDTYNEGDDVTLRAANTFTNEGYTFSEWNTDADGDGDAYAAGDVIEDIQEDIELYAIWTENPVSDDHWVLTDLANLTSEDVFVIVGNNGSNYAMSNDNGTDPAPSAVAVTVTGNEITSTVAANLQWNISGNATDGYTFYPNGSTTTWLYCTNTNNGVRVGTNANKTFVVDHNYLKHIFTSRYVGVYNSQDWRCYTSYTATNINNQTFAFYKKVTGEVLPPSITAANVEITYDATSGSIAYTINNEPTPAGTLTAAVVSGATISNLSLGTPSNGTIAFTCAANTVTTDRTATVTLTYAYGDDEPVTKDVTITQAAAPLIYTTIPDLFAAATTTETNVLVTFNNWVVSGVYSNGKNVFVTDNNGNGFVIFYNSDMSSTFAAGNILSGTAVSCTLKKYNGFAELLNVSATDLIITSGGTVAVADVAMASLAGVNTGALLHYDNLTCSVDNNKYYLFDGTTTIQVYNAIYAFGTLVEGKTYNITGVYQQYNNTKEILPRSAEDIEEVEAQHEEYTLTVSNLSHVNLFIFGGEESETIINTEDGETTAQVYDGAEVLVSIDVEAGYVFQSLTITDGNGDAVETEELTPNEYYSFVMPASNVTITATAEEYVAPTGGDYVRITSLDQLTDGSIVVIAARYDEEHTNGYYAMSNATSGKPTGVLFTSTTSGGNEILPASIVDNEDDYYWTLNETENGYTFTNAEGFVIGYNSSTNFATAGDNTEWSIELSTSAGAAMVPNYTGFFITNVNNDARHFALNSSHNFGPYHDNNLNTSSYNFTLDFFVQSETLVETYELTIDGYTDVTEGTNNKGYYLIASPVNVDPATVEGMTDDDFDLYYFNQSAVGEEWRNYEANHFNLVPGMGYLYAKKGNETYNFVLTGTPYDGDGEIELVYDENSVFPGWNLVGNPFGNNAEISADYYEINSDGSELIANEDYIVDAMQGVFVIAEDSESTVLFVPNEDTPEPVDPGTKVALNVVKDRGNVIDRAVVRFGEGRQLPKFQLNPNHTKIYFQQGNKDYAVVRSANEGEMPVSFKAETRGTYTLNIEVNAEMNYLHLFDNLTGNDVDLLATPSYTFEATPADYATRFRLMFSANTVSENATIFAYFNGSEWIVNNDGNATLQVVDVMGRILRNEQVNGNVTLNLNETPGVYMLRLVNGDNVMIQKIVVR